VIRLEILSGKAAGQIVLAPRFPFQIGRSAAVGLQLAEPGVWDRHCQIEYRPTEGFWIYPLGEAQVRVDDVPVDGSTRLNNSSEVALGSVRLRFSLADPVPRGLRLREALTALFLLAVVLGEAWLIHWLPR
jgi:predicted component of type VI protein secretion system